SDYYANKGQYTRARKYLNDLLKVNKELRDRFGTAMTYQSIGMSYLNEDRSLHTAKNYFNLSLSIFKNVNDNLRQAHVHFNLGTIYFKENDLRNSLRKFEESYFLAKDLKDKQLIMKN